MNENSFRLATGTGANIDVYCGFVPSSVLAVNIDSATGDKLEWFFGMADGSAFKVAGGSRTKITTLGVSILKSPTLGVGFRIGADAAINIAGQRISIIADRGGSGNQEPSYV